MTLIEFIVLVVVLVLVPSLLFVGWAVITAPSGYEDETGFHREMKE